MIRIQIKRKVKLSMTAYDWQLYSGMKGAKGSAARLNRGVEKAINSSDNFEDLPIPALKDLFSYEAKYGATDTEPLWVLHDLLYKVYGKGTRLW